MHTLPLPIGGPAAQTNWPATEVGSHLALLYVHQVNRVNLCHDDSTINIILSVILITTTTTNSSS